MKTANNQSFLEALSLALPQAALERRPVEDDATVIDVLMAGTNLRGWFTLPLPGLIARFAHGWSFVICPAQGIHLVGPRVRGSWGVWQLADLLDAPVWFRERGNAVACANAIADDFHGWRWRPRAPRPGHAQGIAGGWTFLPDNPPVACIGHAGRVILAMPGGSNGSPAGVRLLQRGACGADATPLFSLHGDTLQFPDLASARAAADARIGCGCCWGAAPAAERRGARPGGSLPRAPGLRCRMPAVSGTAGPPPGRPRVPVSGSVSGAGATHAPSPQAALDALLGPGIAGPPDLGPITRGGRTWLAAPLPGGAAGYTARYGDDLYGVLVRVPHGGQAVWAAGVNEFSVYAAGQPAVFGSADAAITAVEEVLRALAVGLL